MLLKLIGSGFPIAACTQYSCNAMGIFIFSLYVFGNAVLNLMRALEACEFDAAAPALC